MTEEEIYSQLRYCKSMIAQNEQRIAEMQKDNTELEQLGSKISSMSDRMSGFPDIAHGKFMKIGASINRIFLQAPIAIVHGIEYSQAVQGLGAAYSAVRNKIAANEEEVQNCKRNINYYYSEINNYNYALRTLQEGDQ